MIYMPMTEEVFTIKMNQLIDQGRVKLSKEKISPEFKHFNRRLFHFKMENDDDFNFLADLASDLVEDGKI